MNRTNMIWDEFAKLVDVIPDVLLDMGQGCVDTEAWLLGTCEGYNGKNDPDVTDNLSDFKLELEAGCDLEKEYDLIELETTTIDTIDAEHGPFDNAILWADIEGAEMKMLQGATKMLTEQRIQCIYLEIRAQHKNLPQPGEII